MSVYAIVTAGGSGTRFRRLSRTKIPKQFVLLNNEPVIVHSLLVFQKSKLIDGIIISSEKQHFDSLRQLAAKYNITKLICLTEGGKTRFLSVKNAFAFIKGSGKDLVLVHDAVRPNIDIKFIKSLIDSARKFNCVIPALPLSETVKKSIRGFVENTIDRRNLFAIQTPQCFNYLILYNAYKKFPNDIGFTDEAALVERAGYKVKIIPGKTGNVKITVPEDLSFLKKIMK
jgi:2-C-methyl-D-erythritol 4-phosphate cytidylyltransferase